jgi:hypothetical protein
MGKKLSHATIPLEKYLYSLCLILINAFTRREYYGTLSPDLGVGLGTGVHGLGTGGVVHGIGTRTRLPVDTSITDLLGMGLRDRQNKGLTKASIEEG